MIVSILLAVALILLPMIIWGTKCRFYFGVMLYMCVVVIFMVIAAQIGQLTFITIGGAVVSFVMLVCGVPKNKKRSELSVPLVGVDNKTYYVEDINAGTLILGASGSGKTQSVIRAYLEHWAKNDFSGLIYDFKDFELTELAAGYFRNSNVKLSIFALHNVNASVRINPIAAEFIETENSVRSIVRNMFLNIKGKTAGDTFFNDAAEGLVVAMIWRMKTHFPELCNLPFICAILLQVEALHHEKPYGNLFDFVTADRQTAIKASTFLSGLESEKQTAAVYATLTNLLLCFDNPNIAYLMSGEDISLDVTHEDHLRVLSIVSFPKDAAALSPINSLIIDLMTNLVRRGRKYSIWLLDEAHTVKINDIETKISYLRSYGGCFVWCMQSKVQGLVRNDDSLFKKIAENLSTQFYGKVNDPETGEYYEKHFEFVKEKQLSYSSANWLAKGDGRVTKSFRERKKVRAHEFQQLRKGEFVMLSGGKDTKFRFKYKPVVPYSPPQERCVTSEQLIEYQRVLLDLAAHFIEGGWKTCPELIIKNFKELQF